MVTKKPKGLGRGLEALLGPKVDDTRAEVAAMNEAREGQATGSLKLDEMVAGGMDDELLGAVAPIYLLAKAAGTRATPAATQERSYARHWTPLHLDFVVADIVDTLQTSLAQRALVVQRLQAGTRLVLDAPIQLGQLGGVVRLLLDAHRTLVHVAHDGLAQRLGTLALQGGNDEHRALPVQTLDHRTHALLALVIEQLVSLVQHQPALTLGQRRAEFLQLANDHLGRFGRPSLKSGES